MIKRFLLCWFVTSFDLLGFCAGMMNSWVPVIVIFSVGFAGCCLWIAKLGQKGESWSYRKIRRMDKELDSINKELKIIKFEVDGKADYTAERRTDTQKIRPGSRPSVTYENMRVLMEGGELNDVRNEAEKPEISEGIDTV